MMMSMMQYVSRGTGLNILIAILISLLFVIWAVVRKTDRKEYLFSILLPCALMFLAILFYAITFSFRDQAVGGPTTIPRIWIYSLIVLSIGLMISVWSGKVAPDKKFNRVGFVFLFVGLLVLYCYSFQYIGYFLSSFLFVVASLFALSYKNKLVVFSIAGFWVIFVYAIFYKTLHIYLPLGSVFEHFMY